jgi:anti-anti-sigma factor
VPQEEQLRVAVRDDGDRSSVVVEGEIDVTNAVEFETALLDAVASARTALTVDLRGVGFLGSEGIRGLIRAHRIACGRDVEWTVAAAPIARRALETAGLDDWLKP